MQIVGLCYHCTPMLNLDTSLLEWINHNRWHIADPFLLLVTNTTAYVAILIALTVLVVGFVRKWDEVKWKGYQLVSAYIANAIVVSAMKHLVNRERPFVHNPLIEKLTSGGSPSFPSGHTADAFVIAMSVALIGTRRWIVAAVWIWACLVGYTRMALGVHYPSDVIGSLLIGSVNAYWVHLFFLRKKEKMEKDANLEEI